MWKASSCIAIVTLLTAMSCNRSHSGSSSASDPNVAAARTAAEAWLALVDGQKYGDSWDQAASIFRSAVPRTNWETAVSGVRNPLGKLQSRRLGSANFETSLPGAPDGKYVVIQYDTVFANKAAAVETITPMQESDGTWKVSGYFIR